MEGGGGGGRRGEGREGEGRGGEWSGVEWSGVEDRSDGCVAGEGETGAPSKSLTLQGHAPPPFNW